jgi:hypothetical protein
MSAMRKFRNRLYFLTTHQKNLSPGSFCVALIHNLRRPGDFSIKKKIKKCGCWISSAINAQHHRNIYQLYHGKIPKTLVIDHICRNRKCINPNHLEAVTSSENNHRRWLKTGKDKPLRIRFYA